MEKAIVGLQQASYSRHLEVRKINLDLYHDTTNTDSREDSFENLGKLSIHRDLLNLLPPMSG